MKKLLLLLLLPSIIFSQKKNEVLKKTAGFSCDCITKKGDVSEMALGLCLFESLNKLTPKEQKAIGYDSEKKMETIKNVASDIGVEMATICPEVFTSLAERNNFDSDEEMEENAEEEVANTTFSGVFVELKSLEFNTIVAKNDANETKEFIWLFSFEGDALFLKNKISKGDKIEVEYFEHSFYDPKKKEYRNYNEITGVKFLN